MAVRVLIVEDQEDSRELMAMLLRLRGFEVLTAADGDAGLRAIREQQPAVALVDLGLPIIDGLEVARQTRGVSDGAQPFLVALTGHGQDADRAAARAAGFDRHLVKPVDLHALLGVLAEALPPDAKV